MTDALRLKLAALADWMAGKPEASRRRSPKWPALRAAHLGRHNSCAVCGFRKHLNVHHIFPFYLFPHEELDPGNLITLGEKCPTGNHHLLFGHLGNWSFFNADVRSDAKNMLDSIIRAPAILRIIRDDIEYGRKHATDNGRPP
jgi:hypothetical protein